MRVAVLCVALALFAFANSQVPKPCIAPSEWSGRMFQLDRAKEFARQARIEYDASGQRIAIIEEVDQGPARNFYFELLLYKEKQGYRLNLQTRVCEKFTITEDFRPIAIPQNATFNGQFFLGTSSVQGAGVLVEDWSGKTTNPEGEYNVVVTVTGCVPINDQFYSAETSLVTTFFYDIVAGIINPDEFIPPPECQ